MTTATGVTYSYDGLDRINARNGIVFSYSGQATQPTSDGLSVISRTPLADPLSAMVGSSRFVLIGDRHNDLVAASDTAGNLIGTAEYAPWGDILASSGLNGLAIGYQGAYADGTTGRSRMGERWYLSQQGRFNSEDSFPGIRTDPITTNRYAFGDDSPMDFVDPSGSDAYSYSYSLGVRRSPKWYTAFARGWCKAVFPLSGCKNNFNAGDRLNLQYRVKIFGIFNPYTKVAPVKVTSVTSTSFSFVSLSGHPEGAGRLITFAFSRRGVDETVLKVTTSSNGGFITNWPGFEALAFKQAKGTWQKLADNIVATANAVYGLTFSDQAPLFCTANSPCPGLT